MSIELLNKDVQVTNESNWMLRLRQKKRQVLEEEQQTKNQIKDYFTQLTIHVQQLEEVTLQKHRNNLRDFLTEVDYYLSMNENQRNFHETELCDIMEFNHKFHRNNSLLALLKKDNLEISQQISFNAVSLLENQFQTTNKKNIGNLVAKQEYQDIIGGLQSQIQSLMVREEKLVAKINQLETKNKSKKVGKNYFPVLSQVDSNSSELRLQRLQAENKILVEQISECSEKILSLRSENSLLFKDGQSQIITTEKKKPNEISRLQEQNSLQLQAQMLQLQEQIIQLKNQMKKQAQMAENNKNQLLQRQRLTQKQLNQKVQQLTDYNERLYSECEANIQKKVHLQEKLKIVNSELESKKKQTIAQSQKFQDYKRLVELKDGRIVQLQNQVQTYSSELEKKQEKFKSVQQQAQRAQEINKTSMKAKQLQVDSLKSIIKKEQSQINILKASLTQKQQSLFHFHEEMKNMQAETAKVIKERDSVVKKEANKIKKELNKNFEEQKKKMSEQFSQKFGKLLERIEYVGKDIKDYKQKYESRLKVAENRMDILKAKVAFEMKQMFQKGCKPANKDKISEVIRSFVESQSAIALKNSTIKQMKQEISCLKKQKSKNNKTQQSQILPNETMVSLQIQKMEKIIWQQKVQTMQKCHQDLIKSMQQAHELMDIEKQQQLVELRQKVEAQQKQLRQYKEIANQSDNMAQTKIQKWKNKLDKQAESDKKNQSYIQGLKNTQHKYQQQTQQLKDQLKVKRDLVQGLKKDLKQKESEKSKLNEAMDGVIQENQRLKRQIKDALRKQAVYENFRDKLEDKKQVESELQTIKKQMDDQQRILRAQINKKDATIRQIKANQEILNKKIKAVNDLQQQILDLKQKIRKLKSQNQRKDTLVQHLKTKSSKNQSQKEAQMQKLEAQSRKLTKDLENEKNRFQNCKSKLHKVESNAKILKIIVMKIFTSIQQKSIHCPQTYAMSQYNTKNTKYEATVQKTPGYPDMSRYKEGLSILQISGEQLGLGYDMNSLSACSPIAKKLPDQDLQHELADRLDGNEVDVKAVAQIFNQLLS